MNVLSVFFHIADVKANELYTNRTVRTMLFLFIHPEERPVESKSSKP